MSLLSRLAVQAARAYGILSAADKTKVAASYLVVAGGGSGGGGNYVAYAAGGGGAGGYRESTFTLSTLNTYTITVGAGATSTTSNGVTNPAGSNSVLSGTGITTVTAAGGGSGAPANGSAGSGGSGGGATAGGAVGSGNTPSTSPSQGNNGGSGTTSGPSYAGGGGGGASAVGANSTSSAGGNGGAGTASSISGSSVTYAGGGGGGIQGGSTPGTGGAGGGGSGGALGAVGNNGTPNTGGGGGGCSADSATNILGGNGGSGIVIISYASATPRFVGGTLTTSGGNQIHTFTSSGTLSPLTPVTASYLVVAGGGAGGALKNGFIVGGGGGGAGGLLTSSTTLYSGATYVVTVGAGGAGVSAGTSGSGSNSVLSGTGLTTITATGGGGGGWNDSSTGIAGGSGGGGANGGSGGAGTSGQGSNGGGSSSSGGSGGGGGASAVGANGSSVNGGNGGAGTASSITGTSITYAGGGGGGGDPSSGGTSGTGGAGGGGNAGATANSFGVAGTSNLGGGGGGCGGSSTATAKAGGNGGSGVVIISYAGSQVFNGGLVTSSGGNTIHTFNATGALTPLTNNLTNSLRFRSSASAYLNRTPTLAGNRRTFTYSAWVKIGTIGTWKKMLSVWNANTDAGYFDFGINNNNVFVIQGWNTAWRISTQLFRDPSAWYHIVVAVDTTQATAANRIKLYVNGNQVTSFSSSSDPTQNYDFLLNSTVATYIGTDAGGVGTSNFDGYQTDINFIDGQALEPYYFGNNDANGVWKPILYKGTYGTNGFYLTFGNTTSTTTLGYDSSPNGNNWTTNNISLTAGTTYDAMTDVPTNTSATVANYCVLNPLVASTTATITNANLNATGSTTTFANARATFTLSSEKWYWEHTITGSSTLDIGIGLCTEASQKSSATNIRQTGWYNVINGSPGDVGSSANGGANISISTTNWATNDIIMIAYDAGTGYIWFGRNGTWYPPTTGGSVGNPAAGTNQTISAVSNLIPASWHYNTNAGTAVNFGQRPFSYTPPSGFVALNTFNLPTPTILQGNKYMDATLYTGNGASTQVIVNQGQFKPDLVWDKARSNTDTNSNMLVNSVVGRAGSLSSNQTSAEGTSPAGFDLVSFNSNGFTVGPASQANMNTSAWTFVAWQWQAGQGSTSSNTSGSITSTTSVSTTAGFSIVTYTGTGANATVGHGLGVAPKMIITRYRGSESWSVYHTSLGGTKTLYLNLTNAANTTSLAWNNTDPTSTVFSLGSAGTTNTSGGSGMVAYCWSEIAGFSKFGSYTGNGSADGPFVYTGFRPKFVLIKRTDAVTSWFIHDTSRDTYNTTVLNLYPNLSAAEETQTTYSFDILSNGFKVRGTSTEINASGGTYIYAAYAENPFKNANAR